MTRRAPRLLCLLAALFVGVLSVALFPHPAYACSCGGTSTKTLASADLVFVGRVTERSVVRSSAPGRTELRFAVSAVYQGLVHVDQVVATPRGSGGCGLDAGVGSTWLIFANEQVQGSGDRAVLMPTTELCSGNVPGGAVPTQLGLSWEPLPGASDREQRAKAYDEMVNRVLLAAGVGAGFLALVLGLSLAASWRSAGGAVRAGRRTPPGRARPR